MDARIALVTDKVDAACEHVAEAWEHRAEAAPCVVPRILWLELALRYASPNEEDATQNVQVILGRLKTAIAREGAHMEWTMAPVLAHRQPRLPAGHYALLAALACLAEAGWRRQTCLAEASGRRQIVALSDAANLLALEQFPAWRDAPAEPIG